MDATVHTEHRGNGNDQETIKRVELADGTTETFHGAPGGPYAADVDDPDGRAVEALYRHVDDAAIEPDRPATASAETNSETTATDREGR